MGPEPIKGEVGPGKKPTVEGQLDGLIRLIECDNPKMISMQVIKKEYDMLKKSSFILTGLRR